MEEDKEKKSTPKDNASNDKSLNYKSKKEFVFGNIYDKLNTANKLQTNANLPSTLNPLIDSTTDLPDELPSDPQADSITAVEEISKRDSSDFPNLSNLVNPKTDNFNSVPKPNISIISNSSLIEPTSSQNLSNNQKKRIANLKETLAEFKLNGNENLSTISAKSNDELSQGLSYDSNSKLGKIDINKSSTLSDKNTEKARNQIQSFLKDDDNYSYKQSNGRPIKIVETDSDNKTLIFNENELKNIFEKNNALDKFIVVCSCTGDFRKGKSFLLNYCLRFLSNNHDYLNKLTPDMNLGWLGDIDDPLVGFSWRSGCDLETTGIWIWSELFPCKIAKNNLDLMRTGSSNLDSLVVNKKQKLTTEKQNEKEEYEDAFICLIDSQGAFDEQSSISDCASIFSIVFLISSMQIYNIFHQLQEDNLQYLQLFTEYGKLIFEDGIHCKPFQRLTFLIRDWFSPSEFKYGNEGGNGYLLKKFQPDLKNNAVKQLNRQHLENVLIRRYIQKCFDKIDCFLLPHPGRYVASSNEYNGNWGDIYYECLIKLKEFVEWWFSDLQIKRTTDYLPKKMTGNEFIKLFKLLSTKLTNNNEVLKPITLFESMAKISHINAIENCINLYQTKMNALFGNSEPFYWSKNIEKICKYLEDQIRQKYLKKKKFGSKQYEKEFITKLNDQFKDIRTYYLNLNALKCSTLPAYLLIACVIILTHILSITVKLFCSFWLINLLLIWLITIEVFLLNLSIAVELFGLQIGSNLIFFIKKRLQVIYHFTRAKPIDLSIINNI